MRGPGLHVGRRPLHLVAAILSFTFIYVFTQLSQQFFSLQQRSVIVKRPNYLLPKSIWDTPSLRAGSCPVQIPDQVDDQFYSQWRDPGLSIPEPCKRPSARVSRIVGNRYLQLIPNRCPGRVLYQTANSINVTYPKPLIDDVELNPNDEAIFVKCVNEDGRVIRDWHLRVQPRDEIGRKSSRPNHVVLILVDSLTREHAIRTLPRTLSFMMQSKSHRLSDFIRFRFNTVGKGTKMNFTPVMFGMSSSKYADSNESFVSIIDRYRHAGYATSFIEEGCVKNTGSMARIIRRKVKADLTDVEIASFMDTFTTIADHTLGNVMCMIMKHMRVHDFFSDSTVKHICYAGQYMHRHLFSYLNQFISQYKAVSKPTFSILKTNEAHERTYSRVGLLDADLEMFMRSIDDDTTVILMGDHGLGYGKLSETMTLTIEYNLPALFFFTPNHTGYHNQLRSNTDRLMTGLDLHATLADMLLKPSQDDLDEITDGVSLLRTVPDRSCKDLSIPSVRCSCSVYTEERTNTTLWRLVAEKAVSLINNETESWRQLGCRQLNLESIISVRQIRASNTKFDANLNDISRGEEHSVFQITVDVDAGKAASGAKMDPERFMLEIQANPSWWRPPEADKCITFVQIDDVSVESGSRPNILLGLPDNIYISIGWNETSCIKKTKQLKFQFIDSSGQVQFSQTTTVEKGWSSSRSTVSGAWTFLKADQWRFVISDIDTGQVKAIVKVHVLDDSNRNRARRARQSFFQNHFAISSVTRISPYSPFQVCTPINAPHDMCICDKDALIIN